MKRNGKWIAMIALLATMLMCASACGKDKDSPTTQGTEKNQTTAQTQVQEIEPTTGADVGDWEDADVQTGQTTESTQSTQGSAVTEATTRPSQGTAVTEATTNPSQATEPVTKPNQTTQATTKPTQGNQATEPTKKPSVTDPTMSEGVEDWQGSQVTEPTTRPTTQPTTKPSQATEPTTKPNQTTQATTKPSQTTEATTQSGSQTESPEPPERELLTYEQYNALSVSEKQAYFKSFADPDAFHDWLDAAKAAYEEQNKDNVVPGDGNINLEDFINNHTKGDS